MKQHYEQGHPEQAHSNHKIKHTSHFSLPPRAKRNEVREIKSQLLYQTFLVLHNYSTQRRQQLLPGDENLLRVIKRLDPNALPFLVRNTANGSTAIVTHITPAPAPPHLRLALGIEIRRSLKGLFVLPKARPCQAAGTHHRPLAALSAERTAAGARSECAWKQPGPPSPFAWRVHGGHSSSHHTRI